MTSMGATPPPPPPPFSTYTYLDASKSHESFTHPTLAGLLLAFVGTCAFAMSYKQFSENPRLWRAQWMVEKREVPLVLNPEAQGQEHEQRNPSFNQVGVEEDAIPVAVEAEIIVDLPPPREHIVELELADFPPPAAEAGPGDAASQSSAGQHARNDTMEIFDNPMQQKVSGGSISNID